MDNYLQDISSIVEKVSIISDDTYTVEGKEYTVSCQQTYTKWNEPLHQFGKNTGEKTALKANLQAQLTGALYSSFYIADSNEDKSKTASIKSDRSKTIQTLSEANTTQNRLDTSWTVYALDNNGNVFVTKNGSVRSLIPNEWEYTNDSGTALTVGSLVSLKIIREHTELQPVFYHVKGSELVSQQAEFVRIYFNTNYKGAVELVRHITSLFNRYRVPFLFKCLNQPELFSRTDSAVLYLDKADLRMGIRLLKMILPRVQSFLKPSVPLFTRTIVPGVSFAEDPGNGQSFGMSRCAFIAEGLINAFSKEMNSEEKQVLEVLKVFQENGINIGKLYLNPNSKYPYDFSSLTSSNN